MIEILYYAFIFPLQSVLGFALESLFGAIKSYGLSIIFLGLIINLILLKLSKIAESKAHKTNALKARCDSKIAEFKRVFKGAELQSCIRTLYKQRHYHPIFALSALGGLALQVPFFIAVLFLLQDFEGIKGESFLWISDLSAPDLILGVHILPILMTIISLVNVWIVAKDRGARIQGIAIAIIFLVLLYRMPSALVLYWTTNMAFSLCNSLLGMQFGNIFRHTERSEVSKSRKSNKNVESISQERICKSHEFAQSQYIENDSKVAKMDSLLSTKAQNDNNIKARLASFFIFRKPLKIAVITLTAILAIGLCATFSLMIYAKDNVQTAPLTFDTDSKARIHFGKWDFLLRSSSISNVKLVDIAWDKAIDSTDIKVIRNAKRFVYFESEKAFDLEKGANLGTITYTMNFTPLLKHILFYYAVILGTLLDIYLLICCLYKYRDSIESHTQTYYTISNYAILCIAFLICVFTPYQLYNTDITQFDSSQTFATLSALFGIFALISFVAIYAISFIPKRFSNFTAFILSLILFSGIVYSFVLVGDYGLIDRFFFQKTPFTNSESQAKSSIIFIIVIFCSMTFILLLYKRLIYIWRIVLLTLVIVTSVTMFQIIEKQLDFIKVAQKSQNDSNQSMPISSLRGKVEAIQTNSNIDCHDLTSSSLAMTENSDCVQSHNNNAGDDSNAQNGNTIKPPYENELFSYSKTDKNIAVIVLDMFSGSHTPYILEQFPYFREQLDGFILFPNTITTANSTIQTIATLIGGKQYAIYNINKNLARSVDKAFIDIGSTFANNGFNVGLIVWTQDGTSNIENTIANNNVFTMDMHNTFLFTNFVNYYYDSGGVVFNNAVKTNNAFVEIELAQLVNFGLFKFLPEFFFRPKIYKNGKWLIKVDGRYSNTLASINYSASFYTLSQIVNTKSTNPTFKFFHSQITHLPYGMYFNNNKCEFFSDKSAWNDYPHKDYMTYPDNALKSIMYQHYDTEVCALKYLSDYITLLKKEGIYDNTQIFVVSDHAGQDSINMPINNNVDTLLLFKDFGAKGILKIDNRLMANYDISSIFCENLKGGCPNVPKNILKNYHTNREIIHALTIFKDKYGYLVTKAYKVHNNIYDEKNWVDISDSKYGIVNITK